MTADEVLVLAQQHGVTVWPGEPGKLRYRSRRGPIPTDLRVLLVQHKPALLALLTTRLVASWDQAEVDRLLGEVRGVLATAVIEHEAGRLTAAQLAAVRTWLEVAEEYARNHNLELARGWDMMVLIRSAVQRAQRATSREVPRDPLRASTPR